MKLTVMKSCQTIQPREHRVNRRLISQSGRPSNQPAGFRGRWQHAVRRLRNSCHLDLQLGESDTTHGKAIQ